MMSRRFDRIDALRGLAMLWMAGFHFSFDLNHFGLTKQDFYLDPFWTWQRSCIVSLFLFCAGLSQGVALRQAQPWRRFWRRWLQVAGCALLVSAGSFFMFPNSFIYFGVLHGIAVMLILTRLSAPLGLWLIPAGALAIGLALLAPYMLGSGAAATLFNSRALNWLGLITVKPITEDYVPMLPWLGLMFWGLAVAGWLLANKPAWLAGPLPAPLRPVAALGRWSLSFYMLHQPVLIGLLTLWTGWHPHP